MTIQPFSAAVLLTAALCGVIALITTVAWFMAERRHRAQLRHELRPNRELLLLPAAGHPKTLEDDGSRT